MIKNNNIFRTLKLFALQKKGLYNSMIFKL